MIRKAPPLTRPQAGCTCGQCPIHSGPLARARREAGWSQKEAAHIVDCHPNHIADIENGRRHPSSALLAKLRSAYEPHLDGVLVKTVDHGGRPRREVVQ